MFKNTFIGVGAANFTVFNSPRRTNNDQEVFHKFLNSYMGGNRPGIWHFTSQLKYIIRICIISLNILFT